MNEYSTLPTAENSPADDARAFLAYFSAARRSTVANMFHHVVRAGAATPLIVIARVRQEIHRRLRWSPREDSRWLLEQVLEALQSDHAGACGYAESVIGWESLPYDERQRQKGQRAHQYQQKYMTTQPPTEKQLAYLQALVYRGPLPENRCAASALIDAARAAKGGRR